MTRGPLAATDRRRQAGHKRARRAGTESEDVREANGHGKHLAHLFTDRRSNKNAEGKRAV